MLAREKLVVASSPWIDAASACPIYARMLACELVLDMD